MVIVSSKCGFQPDSFFEKTDNTVISGSKIKLGTIFQVF